MKAASAEGTRRRSSHSSIGTRAMAITRAAVTGRKNSAPARSANGKRERKPGARRSGSARRAAGRGARYVPVSPSAASEARGRIAALAPRRRTSVIAVGRLLVMSRDNARRRGRAEKARHSGDREWCPWPESNGHSLRNSILSRARLPIPPQGHGEAVSLVAPRRRPLTGSRCSLAHDRTARADRRVAIGSRRRSGTETSRLDRRRRSAPRWIADQDRQPCSADRTAAVTDDAEQWPPRRSCRAPRPVGRRARSAVDSQHDRSEIDEQHPVQNSLRRERPENR